jgi:hypothetical protein
MAVMASVDTPFLQFDTDSQTLNTTGGLCSAIFTNLTRTTQREILIRNRGSVNVLIGKTAAAARWPIEPGDVLRLAVKDLAKVAIKTASSTATVDITQII